MPQGPDVECFQNGPHAVLRLSIPEQQSKLSPSCFILVIDKSGSMETAARIGSEAVNLSRLDVVLHAAKAIVDTLAKLQGSNASIGIVSFDCNASVDLLPTKLDAGGVAAAKQALSSITYGGTTNLWGGLLSAIEMARGYQKECNNCHVLALTDGIPNGPVPRDSYSYAIQQQIEAHGELPCTLNMFGFCYEIKSRLLNEIASHGNGIFGFIPDSNLVGTVLTSNALCNLLVTATVNTTVTITRRDATRGMDTVQVPGFDLQRAGNVARFNIGSLRYGQHRDFIIDAGEHINGTLADQFEVTVQYQHPLTGDNVVTSLEPRSCVVREEEVVLHGMRLRFVQGMEDLLDGGRTAYREGFKTLVEQFLNDIEQTIRAYPHIVPLAELRQDIAGEVSLAIADQKTYDHWGQHYLLAMVAGHKRQERINFKDPGMQRYGGSVFQDYCNIADNIFSTLPVPTSSLPKHVARSTRRITSSAQFNDRNGSCVHPLSLVTMSDGSRRPAATLQKGDIVATPDGSAEIVCVTLGKVHGGSITCVRLSSGLVITPFHPIMHQGRWVFPKALVGNGAELVEEQCDFVVNFVLSGDHVMIINGEKCVTLGHGFQGDVIGHAYFGTHRIIDELQQMRGWSQGRVYIENGSTVRGQDSLVCGCVESTEITSDAYIQGVQESHTCKSGGALPAACQIPSAPAHAVMVTA